MSEVEEQPDLFALAVPRLGDKPARPTVWRDHLPVHPACELVPPMSAEEFAKLVEDVREHGVRDRVALLRQDGLLMLLDGKHRLDAAETVGLPVLNEDRTLAVPWKEVGKGVVGFDPVAYVGSTLTRRHLTHETRREFVANLLKEHGQRSDREIGRLAGVDGKTVAAIRAEAERRAEIPHIAKRIDTRGRQQPATKPPAKPRPGRQETGDKQSTTQTRPSPQPQPAATAATTDAEPPEVIPVAAREVIERQEQEIQHLRLELAAANAKVSRVEAALAHAQETIRVLQGDRAEVKQILKQAEAPKKEIETARKAEAAPAKPAAATEPTLPKTRSEALRLKLDHYQTDVPCKRGHLAPKLVSNYTCVVCDAEDRKRKPKAGQAAARARP